MKIEYIAPSSIEGIWGAIEPWVLGALGNDKSYKTQDIKAECESGAMALWLIYTDELKGFLTCTISQSPQGKTAYAPWLGGKDLGEWVNPAFAQFKEWLKAQGCISYSWIGRKAWGRFLDVDSEQNFYRINL